MVPLRPARFHYRWPSDRAGAGPDAAIHSSPVRALKRAVKTLLRRRGLVLAPLDEHEERVAVVRDVWLQRLGIRTVIDVGANDGGFARRARRTLPEAVLHCFEPLPVPYAKLCE